MARIGSLKPREVVRALVKGGFYVHEQTGSHVQLKHASKPGRVTVPNHQGFDVPRQIVRSIIRQAGLTNDEFMDLLEK
jgi:predicted RNA binding protein YcfA (HicA-like mRNA interferase family)